MWHGYKTANSATLTINTWTTIGFVNVAYDSEDSGAHNAGSGILTTLGTGVATIRTQGIYAVETCLQFQATATPFYTQASFLLTAGANNPHLTTGSTLRFGLRGTETGPSASSQTAVCIADVTPIACYPGDTITVQAMVATATVVTFNTNASFSQGRFSSNFTGHWLCAGT